MLSQLFQQKIQDTLERRREYFRAYGTMSQLLGASEVDKHLMALKPGEVYDEYVAPNCTFEGRDYHGKYGGKPSEFLGSEIHHYRFTRGQWETTQRVNCNIYLTPYESQGLVHEKIIAPILKDRFPWLSDFKFHIYEMRGDDRNPDEFYITLSESKEGHQSLYVPYKALLSGNADAIIERNRTYMESYIAHHIRKISNPLPEQVLILEKADRVIAAILADPVTVKFLDHVRASAPKPVENGPAM